MKGQINCSIDIDVLIALDEKGVNKSALVEQLLRNYLEIKPHDADAKENASSKEIDREIAKTASRLAGLQQIKKVREKAAAVKAKEEEGMVILE